MTQIKNKNQFKHGKLIFTEIRNLIEHSKQQVAIVVNTIMTQLYWNIGKQINKEILKYKRAEYGKQIVASLSQQLSIEFVKGWSEKQLRHCLRTAETIDLDSLKNTQQITPDLVFKDPYFLDFLGLKNNYSEKDLESSETNYGR
jgi:hypothetical protein